MEEKLTVKMIKEAKEKAKATIRPYSEIEYNGSLIITEAEDFVGGTRVVVAKNGLHCCSYYSTNSKDVEGMINQAKEYIDDSV